MRRLYWQEVSIPLLFKKVGLSISRSYDPYVLLRSVSALVFSPFVSTLIFDLYHSLLLLSEYLSQPAYDRSMSIVIYRTSEDLKLEGTKELEILTVEDLHDNLSRMDHRSFLINNPTVKFSSKKRPGLLSFLAVAYLFIHCIIRFCCFQ